MPPLEFQLNLTGQFKAALAGSNAELGKASEGLKGVSKDTELFEAEIGKLSGSLGGLNVNFGDIGRGGSIFTFDLAEGLRSVYEIAEKVVEKTIELGKEIIKVAGDTQDLNLAIKLNVGEGGVEGIESAARQVEGASRYTAEQIKKSWLPLLQLGTTDPAELKTLTAAAIGVSTKLRTGYEGVEKALGAFRAMSLGGGRGTIGALKDLGLNQDRYFADLANLQGWTVEQAKKRTKSGQVDAATLKNVALNQLQIGENGVLGTAAEAGAGTLGATLERLRNLPDTLFSRAADSPGLKAVQKLLDNFLAFATGPKGDAAIEAIANALGRMADTAGPFIAKLPGYTDDAILLFEGLGSILGVVVDLFSGLGTAIGETFGEIYVEGARVWGWFTSFGTAIGEFAAKLYLSAVSIGTDLVHGIVNGITGAIDYVEDAVGNLGHAIVGKLKGLLGIHSPSQVFAEMGGFTAEGFALGLEGGTPRVESAARRAISDTASSAASSAYVGTATSSGPVSVDLDLNFYFEGGTTADQVREFAPVARTEIRKIFDELGLVL